MRLLLSTLLLLGIICLILFIWMLLSDGQPDAGVTPDLGNTTTQTPPVDMTPTPLPDRFAGDTIMLPTNNGEALQINNIVREARPVGADMYAISPDETYSILFNADSNSLAVQITNTPVLEARNQVTIAVAELLGVSLGELCGINAYVGTTIDIDQEYGGQDLGFAGC